MCMHEQMYINLLLYVCVLSEFSDEVTEYIESGTLNGIFVLGRSMGFIGKLLLEYHNASFIYCSYITNSWKLI